MEGDGGAAAFERAKVGQAPEVLLDRKCMTPGI